ncbi:hypothetical protein HMPREF9943_00549 [Eggerthia catenaformis OT 569 = DSM 20559]|uniref:Flavodoxin-like domain-containing protein n=1 Tax=Eggerthia catenaformis OT 569 = DSM 20559 TaxID=999415 RepID=M2NG22_9FIRM|nr:flavodoxin domain-containing protein [Eggerthia catenaformis]EMD17178.1 hypothetical protein HMPREF9943_00549 [Eggerthia catenaformis OT 569 = DSM 20559]
MITILYKTKHGSTRKIGKVLDTYLEHRCQLMDLNDVNIESLEKSDSIVLGIPVYYGKLDEEMVYFVRNHQDLLISKHYSIYVVALAHREFMKYLSETFDYYILKNVKTMAGLGGALYYPELSLHERMILTLMNTRMPVIPKEHNEKIFENFNNDEIRRFAEKIKKIDEAAAQ